MDAVAEGHVRVVGASEVEMVRLTEEVGIAVGGAQEDGDDLFLADAPAGDVALLGGDPVGQLDRAVVAQELLDGALDEPRVVLQAAPLGGVPQERHDGVADEVRRGLVPGPQDQHRERQQLGPAQDLPAVLDRHERAEQVPRRHPPPLGEGVTEVGLHLAERALETGQASGRLERIEQAGQVVGPGLQPLAMLRRKAQHLGDARAGLQCLLSIWDRSCRSRTAQKASDRSASSGGSTRRCRP